VCCIKAGTYFAKGLRLQPELDPALLVALLLLLVVHVVDALRRCVHSSGVSRMPLTNGCELAVEAESADVTPTAFE
jgi:hypothetical protein